MTLATRCTAMLFHRFRRALTRADRAAMRDRAALVRALEAK